MLYLVWRITATVHYQLMFIAGVGVKESTALVAAATTAARTTKATRSTEPLSTEATEPSETSASGSTERGRTVDGTAAARIVVHLLVAVAIHRRIAQWTARQGSGAWYQERRPDCFIPGTVLRLLAVFRTHFCGGGGIVICLRWFGGIFHHHAHAHRRRSRCRVVGNNGRIGRYQRSRKNQLLYDG